jgi:hypothetical protein
MNETFIRLIFCDTLEPGLDEHARWTAVLQALYRLRDDTAHAFLSSINLAGLPNESPTDLLSRSHRMARELLPGLVREYREAKAKADAQTNHNKFLQSQAEGDPFIDGANLTRDAYAGRGNAEPEQPAKLDAWGNVIQ